MVGGCQTASKDPPPCPRTHHPPHLVDRGITNYHHSQQGDGSNRRRDWSPVPLSPPLSHLRFLAFLGPGSHWPEFSALLTNRESSGGISLKADFTPKQWLSDGHHFPRGIHLRGISWTPRLCYLGVQGAEYGCVNSKRDVVPFPGTGNNLNLGGLGFSVLLELRKTSKAQLLLRAS